MSTEQEDSLAGVDLTGDDPSADILTADDPSTDLYCIEHKGRKARGRNVDNVWEYFTDESDPQR